MYSLFWKLHSQMNMYIQMTNFTPKACKHANRTIDEVKVPAKCDTRERLMTRNLKTEQS